MPTTRVRRNRERAGAGGITEADYIYFTAGDFFEAENYEDGKNEADLKVFWEKHRDVITDRFFRENKNKGCGLRPWSFWRWDMPEPQQKTSAGEFDSTRVWDHQRKVYDWVENDIEFLRRLGLLEPWELSLTSTSNPGRPG